MINVILTDDITLSELNEFYEENKHYIKDVELKPWTKKQNF